MEKYNNLLTLAQALPEAVRDNAVALVTEMSSVIEGIGDEGIHWRPSFLRLVQGTTDRGSIPKGTGIGDFVLGEQKVDQPFLIIPIKTWDSRQYWDPDQTNAKMLCWSPDAKFGYIGKECRSCPHQVWNEEAGSVDCNKTKSVLAITADLKAVFSINFSKSNFKVGNELEGLMKKAAVAPYNRVYGLTSADSTTAKNVVNFKIEALDEKKRRTDEAYIPFLKELFSIVGADRKASLEGFYEIALQKKAELALEAPAETKALENTTVVEVAPATDAKAAASPLAKGYKV